MWAIQRLGAVVAYVPVPVPHLVSFSLILWPKGLRIPHQM
jgi:hypothetical protein